MAAGKVSGSKLGRDRQAALLALADSIGDAKAAAKFGIRSPRTVYNYRQALKTDAELLALYEAAKERQEAVDDRVVEAQAAAEIEVWGAIKATAERLKLSGEPASPEYLEALARVIEAGGKNTDQRAEVELARKMLDGTHGQRTTAAATGAANGGRPAQVGSTTAAGAVAAVH